MNGYELPSSVSVGGTEYPIRTDYRAVLDVFCVMNDAEIPEQAKNTIFMIIMFPGWRDIPLESWEEAIKKACEFIDMGQKDDGKSHPRLVDWEQDAAIIVPAVNNVAHTEIRALPYMHWWTFWGHFMSIGESLFSSVLSVRTKKAHHKKLEKHEEEFYRNNRDIVEIKRKETAEEKAVKDAMMKWL